LRRTLLLLLVVAAVACRAREKPGASAAAPEPTPAQPPLLGYIDESGEGPPRSGGTLRRRLYGDPTTLNAVLQSGVPDQQVLQYVSRNLLDFDSGMRLVPGLAESWEVSPDGRELTFRIHPAAAWEDGSPVGSADAVFTIRKIADEKTPSPVFKPVFDSFETVTAVDPKTFRVRFREPYAYRAMAFVLPLLPEKAYAGKNFARARENRSPLSNGPYRLLRWTPQESIELERNPRYWGTPGHFDRVVFRILPEDSVAYQALRAGDLDETGMDATLKARSETDTEFQTCCRLVEFYNLDYTAISLNHRSPFFSDARVRRAMTMFLDRAAVVRSLFGGAARIISGPWAPESPAYDASITPLPFDPAAASALLGQAGWSDTNGDGLRDREGKEFRFELLVSSGSAIGRQINELLAAELARAGVEARVVPLEWAAYVERLDRGEFEAASGGWSASDPNPDPFPYWHSSQWPPRGLNSSFYRNEEADRLMEQARRELDENARREIYHRLHALFREDAPAIFVANTSRKHGLRNAVRGLVTSPLGLFGSWPGPVGWWSREGSAGSPGAATPAKSP
jgi:peptide/nickel transport system substrate-binding protein